ncbi:type II secretion system minor pseudopilin GspI [Acinetobacter sp. S40]|nr:type II secretion system minor pseudopilin GspI [Acinetobacter sp. S40]
MKTKPPDFGFWSCLVAKRSFAYAQTLNNVFSFVLRPSITRFNPHNLKYNFSSCARTKLHFVNPRSGFTLLEVMVALAIFAAAAIALTKVGMQYTQSTANAILRTKAQFVAMNEAAQMEINKQWLTGTESKQITSQGETWQIDKRSESTISPNVQRVEIQVSLFNNEQGKVESGITNVVFFNYPQQVKTQ